MRLEIFSPQGQLVHEQVFEGEVLGFRDDVMTWDLKPSASASVSPSVFVFRVTWETNLVNLRNMQINWSFFEPNDRMQA